MNYLAKPLNTFEEWMNGDTTEDFEQFSEGRHSKTKSNPYLNQIPENSSNFRRKSVGQTPTRPSAITSHSKSISSPPTSDKSKKDQQDFTKLEINCLESMRIGFNFLKNCQKQNNAIDMGTYVIPESAIIKGENEALALTNFKTTEEEEVEAEKKEIEKVSTALPSSRVYSYQKIDETSGEGDLSATAEDLELKSPMTLHKCEKCHKSLLKIDALNEKLDSAQKLIHELEGRLNKEIKSKKASQQAKEVMDKEIEEITAELFARANQMVIDESRKVEELYAANKDLTKQMKEAAARLKERELELFQASQCLHELQSTTIHSSSFSKQISVKKSSQTEVHSPSNKTPTEFNHTIIAGFDRFPTTMAVDGFIFQEFQELIKVMVVSANTQPAQAFQAIHSTLFMKRCQLEDVEPCLYYNYQVNSTFKAHGPGLTQSLKKRILDLCIRGQVQTAVAEISETSSIPKTKCLMCTAIRECEYLVKLGAVDLPKPEVVHSCRACRDRLVAVTDFFTFVSFIGANTQGSTILSTFKQVLWLRRRMQLAKIGSSSMFETEVTAMLGPGGAGDWEKNIDVIY
ncbi:RAB3A interacting protein [Terramyces sp. JEL0728]|nr:RAB3A interacting protein [Terramyces sp. JEL0728]